MKKAFLLLLLPLLFLPLMSKADHVVGSDILYKCLGNGRYQIIFKFYRDCNGCKVDGGGGGGTSENCPNPVINIAGANGSCNGQSITGVFTTPMTRQSIKDITNLCGSTKSRCDNGSFPYGVEEHLYTGIIDLSAKIAQGCCKFKISTTIYVRSTTITTGAASAGFYTEAEINACDGICNNSPAYTSYPVAIICVGQDFVFNNGAVDTLDNGDSLSYNMGTAYQGPGSPVNYSGSFSAERPLTFLGFPNANITSPAGFHLDSITGDLAFRPTKLNETAVLVIEVTEWRKVNGVMTQIGKTRRDMQIIVVNCPNNQLPKIDGPYSKQACAGQQVCFTIKTQDPDNKDTVVISWNRGIPRATFTNNNGTVRLASGSVCWTPAESDISNIPYTFTITARDNACPLPGMAVRSFSIYVRESPKATRNYTLLTCGRVIVEATPAKSYAGGITSEWRLKDSTGKTYAIIGNKLVDTIQMKPGMNFVNLNLSTITPCVGSSIDTVIIPPYVEVILPNDTFICKNSTITLNTTLKNGTPQYKYKWSSSASDTLNNLFVRPKGDTTIAVQVTDGQGCKNTDTIFMAYKPIPDVTIGADKRICFSDSVTLDAGTDSTKLKFLWSTSDTSRMITVRDSNRYIAKVTDSIGCSNYDTMLLYVNTVPVSGGPDKFICYNDTAKLTATGGDNYKWYEMPSSTLLSSTNKMQKVLTTTTDFRVWSSRTYAALTCENWDTVNVTVNPLPVITFSAISPKCEKAMPFNLTSEGISYPTLTSGTWTSPSNPSWISSNFFYFDSITVTNPSGVQAINVKYTVTDQNGCTNSSVTSFNIIKLPVVNLQDTSVCSDKGKIDLKKLVLAPTNILGGVWKWESADFQGQSAIEANGANALFNLSAVPQGKTYPMCLKVTNSTGCSNTNCINITSRVVPLVEAGYLSDVCENDTIFIIPDKAGTLPRGGVWQSTAAALTADSLFNPALSPNDNNYRLFYTYDIPGNRCPVTDSVDIYIKAKPFVDAQSLVGVCIDTGTLQLAPYASPLGGIWSGVGVSTSGQFTVTDYEGNNLFKYDYKDPSTGCSSSDTTSIYVQALPALTLTLPDAACEGTPFTIKTDLVNAGGVLWSLNGAGSFSNNTGLTTVYTPGTGESGCLDGNVVSTANGLCKADSKNFQICIYPYPTASMVATPTEGCEPLTVDFKAITDLPAGAKFSWNFGDPASSTNKDSVAQTTHIYQTNGTYTAKLSITSKDNCTTAAPDVVITAFPVPVAAIDANKWITTATQSQIQFYDKSTIDAPGIITDYLWHFGDPKNSTSTDKNPFFEYPADSGTYLVTLKVISDKFCENEVSRKLVVQPQITVFIPNAFIPGASREARNNDFHVVADGYKDFELSIFNRWGEQVFHSLKIEQGWDGNFKGQPVQQDVYIYYLKVSAIDGKEYEYKGTITLLR